jgi:uncharacterized membrane protein YeaQ/YmgE (transglycosylase-associated protein family)
MDFVLAGVIGIVMGILVRLIVPRTTNQGGWLGDVIVGMVGALIGAYIIHTIGMDGHVHPYTAWLAGVAFISAAIFLLLGRAFSGRRVS